MPHADVQRTGVHFAAGDWQRGRFMGAGKCDALQRFVRIDARWQYEAARHPVTAGAESRADRGGFVPEIGERFKVGGGGSRSYILRKKCDRSAGLPGGSAPKWLLAEKLVAHRVRLDISNS